MQKYKEAAVCFSELRQLVTAIPNYLASQAGVSETPTLKTTIEDDWGMSDLDTETLILDFSERYQVDLSNFDFTGFISYDKANHPFLFLLFFFPALFLLFILWSLKVVAALLVLLFNYAQARRIWSSDLIAFWVPLQKQDLSKVLTVGDFVASAATGYFVKREHVRFILYK